MKHLYLLDEFKFPLEVEAKLAIIHSTDEPLHITLSSVGGFQAGIATIFDALESFKHPIHLHLVGEIYTSVLPFLVVATTISCARYAVLRTDKNSPSIFLSLYLSPLPSYPDHSPLAPILPSIQMSLIRNSYANN